MKIARKSMLYSALILMASSIGLQLLGFAYRIFLSWKIGADGMGVFQLVMPVYAIIMAVSLSGLATAVTAVTSERHALGDSASIGKVVRLAIGLFLALFAVSALPVALFSGWISINLLGDGDTRIALLILLPCIALTGFENIFKAFFYGIKNVKPPAISDQLEQIVRIIAVAALLLAFRVQDAGTAAALIIAGMTISEVFSSCLLAVLYRRASAHIPKGRPDQAGNKRLLAQVLAIALPVSAAALANNLISSANIVLIPQRLMAAGYSQNAAVSALGVMFGMALPLFMIPMAFIGPIATLILPKLTESCALNNTADVQRKAGKALQATSLIALPVIAVMTPLGPSICRLIYGQELPLASFMWMAAGTVFVYYQIITTSVLNGIGMQRRAMAHVLVGGMVQLLFTWFAVSDPKLGMTGFLMGYTFSSFIVCALNLTCMAERLKLRVNWLQWFVLPTLGAAVTGLAAWNVYEIMPASSGEIPAILASIGTGIVFCLAALHLQGIGLMRYLKTLIPRGSVAKGQPASPARG